MPALCAEGGQRSGIGKLSRSFLAAIFVIITWTSLLSRRGDLSTQAASNVNFTLWWRRPGPRARDSAGQRRTSGTGDNEDPSDLKKGLGESTRPPPRLGEPSGSGPLHMAEPAGTRSETTSSRTSTTTRTSSSTHRQKVDLPTVAPDALWSDLSPYMHQDGPFKTTVHLFRNVCLSTLENKAPGNPLAPFFADDRAPKEAVDRLKSATRYSYRTPDSEFAKGRPRRWFKGTSFLPQCRWARTQNPSHLLFGTSLAMLWARKRPPRELIPMFDRVILAYCPDWRTFKIGGFNSSSTGWIPGRDHAEIAFSLWADGNVGLLPDLVPARFPIIRGTNCFEELYVADRFGALQDPEDEGYFLAKLAERYASHAAVLRPNITQLSLDREERCRTNSLRIAFWARESTSYAPRRALNLREVISASSNLSTIPIALVSANKSSTTIDHIRIFNSLDVLVAPTGSHLAGLVYSGAREKFAVIELAPAARQGFWALNAKAWNMTYVWSHGHAPEPAVNLSCRWRAAGRGPQARVCKNAFGVTDSAFWVDVGKFLEDLRWTIREICGGKWSALI